MAHTNTTFVLLDPTAADGEAALDRLTDDDVNITLIVLLGLKSAAALREYAAVEQLELNDAALVYLQQVAHRIDRPNRQIELCPLDGDPAHALATLQNSTEEWRLLLPNAAPPSPKLHRAREMKSWWPSQVVHHFTRPLPPVAGALAASPLARRAPASEIATLDRLGTLVEVESRTNVITHGSVGKMACVVIGGSLSVERRGEQISVLRPGDFAGEISLISGERCNADVIANESSSVLALNPVEFAELLDTCPRITKHILQSTVRRLQPA